MMYISDNNLGQIPTIGYSRHYAGVAPSAEAVAKGWDTPAPILETRPVAVSRGRAGYRAVPAPSYPAVRPLGYQVQPGQAYYQKSAEEIAGERATAAIVARNVARGCPGVVASKDITCENWLSRQATYVAAHPSDYSPQFITGKVTTYGTAELQKANDLLLKIRSATAKAKQMSDAAKSAAFSGDVAAARIAANESIKAANEAVSDAQILSQSGAAVSTGLANQGVEQANIAIGYANDARSAAEQAQAVAPLAAPTYAAAPAYAAAPGAVAPAPAQVVEAPAPTTGAASYWPYIMGAGALLLML